MRTAVCTGSFDPPTLGHMDIFMRAAELFDMVYVAVLTNPNKKPVFTADERCGLLMEAARAEGLNNVCAEAYSGLAVDFARQKGAAAIIRGPPLRITPFTFGRAASSSGVTSWG